MFHELTNENYIGIITILDYEIKLNQCLSELSFPSSKKDNLKKVIVDLSLKCGINKYRFVEFNIDNDGKILLKSHQYIDVKNEIEQFANTLLKEKREIVLNSILPQSKKQEILNM